MKILEKEIELEIELDNGSIYKIPFTIAELLSIIADNVPYEDLIYIFDYLKNLYKQGGEPL